MPRQLDLERLGNVRRRLTALTCGSLLWIAAAPAQDASGGIAGVVSFKALVDAVSTQDYTVVQLRRFFASSGVVSVREEIRVDANGTERPAYELDYLGVEGEVPGSSLWRQWGQTYSQHGAVFVEHGLFQVRDLEHVVLNYTLHDFGTAVRAGRSARRVVVFPSRLDKSIWLIEVDDATRIPLYTAEYDAQLRLLSEIEAVTFTLGSQLGPPASMASLVTTHPSFAAAQAAMGGPSGLLEPGNETAEYGLGTVKVRIDPLNNRQTLILSYTDGIDEFFVMETPGAPDVFGALPVRQRRGESNTIARYRDPGMSVLLFWDDGVSFQVAGRGALTRLDSFARQIYTRALLGS